MTTTSVTDVLTRANAAMVGPHRDVTGALAQLLAGVLDVLSADAAAVLVTSDDSLEVLAATSHRATDLEIHQIQLREGPCLDALRTDRSAIEHGESAIVTRWPQAGPVILAAGYTAVQATPLRWHDDTFGALNVFWSDERDFAELAPEARAMADALTCILVSGSLGSEALTQSLHTALQRRGVVEQAKGALAHVLGIDTVEAFDALNALARREDVTLGRAAERVMALARRGTLADHVGSAERQE